MGTNVISPNLANEFIVKIDNTQQDQPVTAIRMSLTRTVRAGDRSDSDSIKVTNEELARDTNAGGPKNQTFEFELKVVTPWEVVEKHLFNTDDDSTKYGSILAPTYRGHLIQVSYQYELRVWHKAFFGSDSVSLL